MQKEKLGGCEEQGCCSFHGYWCNCWRDKKSGGKARQNLNFNTIWSSSISILYPKMGQCLKMWWKQGNLKKQFKVGILSQHCWTGLTPLPVCQDKIQILNKTVLTFFNLFSFHFASEMFPTMATASISTLAPFGSAAACWENVRQVTQPTLHCDIQVSRGTNQFQLIFGWIKQISVQVLEGQRIGWRELAGGN